MVEEPISIQLNICKQNHKNNQNIRFICCVRYSPGMKWNNFTGTNLNFETINFANFTAMLLFLSYRLRLSQFIPLRISISLYRLLTLYMNCYYASSNQRIWTLQRAHAHCYIMLLSFRCIEITCHKCTSLIFESFQQSINVYRNT